MPVNHENNVQNFLTRSNYRNIKRTKQDILNALRNYQGLEPKLEKYTFNDGRVRDLVCLRGTIPVTYRNNSYNIPVGLYILDTHPVHAPLCYIMPTSEMEIKVSSHVDQSGRIYLPYLHEWKDGQSDILGLIQVCIIVFGDQPPVFSRVAGQPKHPPVEHVMRYMQYGSTPYPPTPASQTYPPVPYPPATSNFLPAFNTPAYPPAFQTPDVTGTITQEHLKASLLSAVEDKIRRALREEYESKMVELQSLSKIKEELSSGQERVKSVVNSIDRELTQIKMVLSGLETEQERLTKTLHALESAGEDVNPDEVITATTPLYKQLVNSYAEEAAIEDAIYYLGEALRHGKIDCEDFLKYVRKLSRRQFVLRATMIKCRQTAGLIN